MKTHHKIIAVQHHSQPPVVEIDTESQSAYVRFSDNRVVATISDSEEPGPIITIDLDKDKQVVGVELIGVKEFGIKTLLHKAPISVPPELLDKARYIAAIAAQRQKSMAIAPCD